MSKKDRDSVWAFQFASMRSSIQTLKTAAARGEDIKYPLLDVIDKMETAMTAVGMFAEITSTDLDKLETHRR